MIGETISHYKILEKLGSGGMGVVYKAQDTKLERFVALKFLPPHLSQDEENKKRFIHEAKAASALNNINISTIYEIDEADGQMFIAMEYVQGKDLKSTLSDGRLSIEDAMDYAGQIAEGLAKAHEKDIIHRDIKPANILITEECVVKIVDFGLAKLAGRTMLTKEGTTLGTIAYMSPEQTQGGEIDNRTDIWSLGVILYELITGQQPFKGDYEQAVVYSILNEEPESIINIRSGLPAGLEHIVNKSIAKDPNERYRSLGELIMDLKALDISRSLSNGAKSSVFSHRHVNNKILYRGIGALVLLFVFFATYIYYNQKTNSGKSEEVAIDSDISSYDHRRIAVLPLVNISQNPEDEYFADGMKEELIATLSKITSLRVIARTSIMRYKNNTKSIAEIGQDLQVGTILEGSVRQAENKLRITVQLIDIKSEEPLWSQDYDKELKDVFEIQSDVAQQVAEALEIRLLAGERKKIDRTITQNLDAYNLYLKGRFFWNKRDVKSLKKGIEYFEQAIDIDSNFALAYAGLADSYGIYGRLSGDLTPIERQIKSRENSLKALEIDNNLAEAHASLAVYYSHSNWDWLNAELEFKRAIELNPNYATAHHWYSYFLMTTGQIEEGLTEQKIAQDLNPLSLIINSSLGRRYYWARRYDLAIEQLQKTLDLDRDFAMAHHFLGLTYEQMGSCEKTQKAFNEAINLSVDSHLYESALAHSYAICGMKEEAEQLLEKLKARSKSYYISPFSIAVIYSGFQDKDQAFEWLEKAFADKDGDLVKIKVDPRLDNLREDPRYRRLLIKLGLE